MPQEASTEGHRIVSMRIKPLAGFRAIALLLLLGIFVGISTVPARAMGYISWTPSAAGTSDFSQSISLNSASANTAWKAQVRISSEMLFGIAVVQKSIGIFNAEFGTYYNQGVQNVAIPGQTCTNYSASGTQQNLINCAIPITLSIPAKFALIISRDSSDPTGQNWTGSIKNPSTGTANVIAKFNVGIPNLTIQDVLEYTYPFGDECQMLEQNQQAIYWRPSSSLGDYSYGTLSTSTCGKVQFMAPSQLNKVDGVGITINPSSVETQKYTNSIYEILYPDAWTTAYSAGTSTTQSIDNKAYSDLQATMDATIKSLQDQLSLINQQMADLMKQLAESKKKITKICSTKKRPIGC